MKVAASLGNRFTIRPFRLRYLSVLRGCPQENYFVSVVRSMCLGL